MADARFEQPGAGLHPVGEVAGVEDQVEGPAGQLPQRLRIGPVTEHRAHPGTGSPVWPRLNAVTEWPCATRHLRDSPGEEDGATEYQNVHDSS